ncbi:hypothetical protein C7B61_12365 [filamentous cyanobacterium CCP1]|nr:hypothetical protein C7B61_12365 [filamentous cyanobacterium CCP1]
MLGALSLCFTADSNRHYTQSDLTLVNELAHRAALALDNAQLYQQAQNANRAKDQFLAVLSHELRTPLNPILGWSRLLQTAGKNESILIRGLEAIERNAKLQTQLIEDLLDISRILRGKLRLDIGKVDLKAAIEMSLETVRLAAEAKGIQIQTEFEPVGYVSGDFSRLQQVAWNLLSNAVKFTPEGGQVFVSLRQVGSCAQIQVSDTGKGITSGFLPYIFDYFRQADSKTTRKFGGLGLGLAIVRHIVEMHGGTAEASSPGENQGATLTVKLPLLKDKGERQGQMTEHWAVVHPESDDTQDSLQNVHILVVDDEPNSLELVVSILEYAGATVTAAASGLEALETLVHIQPDVVISDIGMPHMNGYELIKEIQAIVSEAGKSIVAIALTAYVEELYQQEAIENGFQFHFAKPIKPNELVQTIAMLIENRN